MPALRALGGVSDARVLEIGCGDGRLTFRYAPTAGSVLAIDSRDEAIAKAKNMESTLARDEIHTFMGDRGLLFFFPLPNRRWLIAADLPTQHDAVKEQPSLEDVRAIASERGPTGIRISDPRWHQPIRPLSVDTRGR
jgi:SAM-dependent methyltransferase